MNGLETAQRPLWLTIGDFLVVAIAYVTFSPLIYFLVAFVLMVLENLISDEVGSVFVAGLVWATYGFPLLWPLPVLTGLIMAANTLRENGLPIWLSIFAPILASLLLWIALLVFESYNLLGIGSDLFVVIGLLIPTSLVLRYLALMFCIDLRKI